MRSRRPSLRLATRALKRELCPKRYVSRMTQTENFRSQNFFIVFWKPLFSTFHATLFFVSRKTFRFLEVCAYPSIHNFGLEAPPLLCDLGRHACPQKHELGSGSSALRGQIENDSDRKKFESKFFFWKRLFFNNKNWSPHLVKNI